MSTSRTRTRTLAVLAALGAGILSFAGCATVTVEPAGTGGATAGPGASAAADFDVEAGWLDGGRMIAVVTWGSSTCVPTASEATLQADGSIAVTLEDPPADTACTRDYVPRATGVALPTGVAPGPEIDIVVSYGELRDDTELDAYTGGPVEESAPSAGWVDDDAFAILTWGSSSCKPTIESVTADSASAVTVTFADFPAGKVCTADMGPRVVLASVSGVDDDNATVTLTGGDLAAPVTVPIYEG